MYERTNASVKPRLLGIEEFIGWCRRCEERTTQK